MNPPETWEVLLGSIGCKVLSRHDSLIHALFGLLVCSFLFVCSFIHLSYTSIPQSQVCTVLSEPLCKS